MKNIIRQPEAVDSSAKRMKENLERPWGLSGATTGHFDLDMAIGGWMKSKLTTIAARSGQGKTMLLNQMIDTAGVVTGNNMAVYLVLSWEMEPSYLIDRYVCRDARITNKMLTQGVKLLSATDLDKIASAQDKARNKFVYYQTVRGDIKMVEEYFRWFITNVKEKYKDSDINVVPVAVIDYINMADFGSQSKHYGLLDFMNALKSICKQEEAAACALAQISREADNFYKSNDPFPKISKLSDSKGIEDASDNVVLMFRPMHAGLHYVTDPISKEEEYPVYDAQTKIQKLYMDIAKCRDFGPSTFWMDCDPRYFDCWSEKHTPLYNFLPLYENEDFWKSQLQEEVQQLKAW